MDDERCVDLLREIKEQQEEMAEELKETREQMVLINENLGAIMEGMEKLAQVITRK